MGRKKGKYSTSSGRRSGLKTVGVTMLCLLLVLGIAAGALYYYLFHVNEFYLDIRMNGENDIILEYGDTAVDPGASVYLVGTKVLTEGKCVREHLLSQNQVDSDVLGVHTIFYSAEYKDYFLDLGASVRRFVTVVDTCPPEITLVSAPEKFTIPGESYAEEGYSATDNYDGDLTDKVVAVESDGVVTYTVRDSSGNETIIQRPIRYHDPIAPELTLAGKQTITITAGGKYSEPGYTAIDNCDGDITANVQITGQVDTSKAGTYTLTYTVTDSYGNTATATRTVKVEPKPETPSTPTEPDPGEEEFVPPVDVPSGEKVVYLTFDDGPTKHTAKLLDILDKYGVKATFFVVGTSNTDLYDDIVNRGHAIGIHCYSHKYSEVYASDEAYLKDLETMRLLILEKTGVDTRLLRFPGGSSNTASRKHCKGIMTRMTQKVQEMGFQYFDWNVDSNDAGGAKTSDKVYQNVVTGLSKRNVSIVLQHDTSNFSVEAVEKIIQWALENGYTFATLDVDSPAAHHTIRN